jgi:hypothetical protein
MPMAERRDVPRLHLRIGGPLDAVLAVLRQTTGVIRAHAVTEADENATGPHDVVAEVHHPGVAEDVARAVVHHGFALLELAEGKADLERIFLDLTQRAAQAAAA